MIIRKSAEDYLEMILMVREEKGVVRSIDIATALEVSKPSVSVAMKRLRENGFIDMDGGNLITLTESGQAIAERIYARHKTLARCLEMLGVDPALAREDACRLEHDISDASYAALCAHLNKLEAAKA